MKTIQLLPQSRGPSAHERSSLTLKAMYEHGGVKLCSELKTSTTSINLDYLKPGRKPGKNKDCKLSHLSTLDLFNYYRRSSRITIVIPFN